jgi:hypothetical protein
MQDGARNKIAFLFIPILFHIKITLDNIWNIPLYSKSGTSQYGTKYILRRKVKNE